MRPGRQRRPQRPAAGGSSGSAPTALEGLEAALEMSEVRAELAAQRAHVCREWVLQLLNHARGVGELVRGRGRYLGHLMRGKGGWGRWWSAQVSVNRAVTGRFSKNV